MKKFELLLKNEKTKSYNRISTLIIVLNLALFALFAVNLTDKKTRITGITGSVLLMIFLLIPYFSEKIKNEKNKLYTLPALYTATILWLAMGYWWPAIICFLLSLLYQVSKRPLFICFSQEKINYSSFPKRELQWPELSNVILKDGILTMDFKNNRILQAETDQAGPAIIEKEFNDFCRQQLIKGTPANDG
jgi:hypothetical protein